MKKIILAIAVVALTLTSCKSTFTSPYSDSQVIEHSTQGSVTLRGTSDEIEGGKKDIGYNATKAAHKKALQQLFYFGFVGTDFKNPMIREGIGVETKHKAFFDQFWNGGYERFVTDSKTEFYDCEQKSKCTVATSTVTVNYNMLRKELENNKVLNKIGF